MGRKLSLAAACGAAVVAVALLMAAGAAHWLEGAIAETDFSALLVPVP